MEQAGSNTLPQDDLEQYAGAPASAGARTIAGSRSWDFGYSPTARTPIANAPAAAPTGTAPRTGGTATPTYKPATPATGGYELPYTGGASLPHSPYVHQSPYGF